MYVTEAIASHVLRLIVVGEALPRALAKVLLVCLLLLCAVWATASVWHVRRRRMVKLRGRERLSLKQFYDRFYTESGLDRHSVTQAVRDVSAWLLVPPGVLRPSDRFGIELRQVRALLFQDSGFSGLKMVLDGMVKRALKRGPPPDASWRTISTLDDFISVYCLLARAAKPKREGPATE